MECNPPADPLAVRKIKLALQEFETPSNCRGLCRIGITWCAILLFSLSYFLLPLLPGLFCQACTYFFIVLIIAGRLRGLESCVHEAGHSSVFRTRKWNTQLQFLFAWPIFEQVESYKREHLVHHSKLGTPKDPAHQLYLEVKAIDFHENWWKVVIVRPLLGWCIWWYFRQKIALFRMERRYRMQMTAFWSFVLLIVGSNGLSRCFVFMYLVPAVLVLPILVFFSELTDHLATDQNCRLRGTRNNLGCLQNLFIHAHHDGYHLVHHLNPRIPAHRLRESHRLLMRSPEFRSFCVQSHGTIETFLQMYYYAR
jgi:fatty acid desaturase